MNEKIQAMKDWFKEEEKKRSERLKKRSEEIQDHIEDVTSRMQKDKDGKPILFFSSRVHRRAGAGGLRKGWVFAEKMAIPKKRK